MKQTSFILKGNICHTPTREKLSLHEGAYLVCEEGICRGVFNEIPEAYRGLAVTDLGDRLILPGMVDLHLHAPQYTFRGMCMDLELMDWLERYTFPEEERYAELAYAERAYSIFADAMRESATSRACIFATRHRQATELLMEKMEQSGLISYVGKVNMDREASEALVEESAEMSAYTTIGWINAVRDRFARTKPILTPRFIPCCTDRLMEELHEIQMAYGIPVQSHLSESPGEIAFVQSLRPNNAFYGDAYDEHGLFGRNSRAEEVGTVMAHCVWSGEEEVELMRRNGVFVAHCPASNMNLTSGIAPIRRYLSRGLRVGIGTDVAAGQSLSMFRAITDAIMASKMYFRLVDSEARPLVFSEAFYLATKGGGAFFGRVGSFEEGYELDAIVLDDAILPSPRSLTLAERVERAVYLGLDEKALTHKLVRGETVALSPKGEHQPRRE